jgi:hypothetical protein
MDGYAKIAHLMGHHSELAIMRRFSTLNIQNILYLQAKLTFLENDLRKLAQKDRAEPSRSNYSKDWWSLANSTCCRTDKRQWKKVLEIRKTLKEYSRIAIPVPSQGLYVK